MPARILEGMMVIMPSLSLSQDADERVIHRKISCLEHLATVHVADTVHSPGDVPGEHSPHCESPEHCWQSTE